MCFNVLEKDHDHLPTLHSRVELCKLLLEVNDTEYCKTMLYHELDAEDKVCVLLMHCVEQFFSGCLSDFLFSYLPSTCLVRVIRALTLLRIRMDTWRGRQIKGGGWFESGPPPPPDPQEFLYPPFCNLRFWGKLL